jgi:hypothetical protein
MTGRALAVNSSGESSELFDFVYTLHSTYAEELIIFDFAY